MVWIAGAGSMGGDSTAAGLETAARPRAEASRPAAASRVSDECRSVKEFMSKASS
jgi:hypothetical protein